MTLPSRRMSLSSAEICIANPPPIQSPRAIGWALPPRALVVNSLIGGHGSERGFFFLCHVSSSVHWTSTCRFRHGNTCEIKLHVRGAAGNRAQWEARDVWRVGHHERTIEPGAIKLCNDLQFVIAGENCPGLVWVFGSEWAFWQWLWWCLSRTQGTNSSSVCSFYTGRFWITRVGFKELLKVRSVGFREIY